MAYSRRRYGRSYRRYGRRRSTRRRTSKWPKNSIGWNYDKRRRQLFAAVKKHFNATYPARYKEDDEQGTFFAQSDKGSYDYNLTGKGDYRWSRRMKPSIGARIGAWVGDRAQGWLKRFTGWGDYTEAVPQPDTAAEVPAVVNQASRTVVISNKEYLGDIISGASGAFNLQSFKINPGNPVTFPWLSTIASCFQQYRFQGLVFHFKTTSADALNSTNTALGQVIMATNYNVVQPNFQSKYEMENTEFAISCKPSVSCNHAIENAAALTVLSELYVAPDGIVPNGQPEQFANFANFQIATNGMQGASVNVGELWVTYEVALMKPIVPSVSGIVESPVFRYSATSQPTTAALNVATPLDIFLPTTALSYSAFPVLDQNQPFKLYPVSATVMRFEVSPGSTALVGRNFVFWINFRNADTANSANSGTPHTVTLSANASPYNIFSSNGTNYLPAPIGSIVANNYTAGNSYETTSSTAFRVVGAGNIDFTLAAGNLPGSLSNRSKTFDCMIYEIPDGLNV